MFKNKFFFWLNTKTNKHNFTNKNLELYNALLFYETVISNTIKAFIWNNLVVKYFNTSILDEESS